MKKHKRGDIREDGMVFWQYYHENNKNELWVTPEQFEIKKRTIHERNKKRRQKLKADFDRHPRLFSKGDTREDGMVFLSYKILILII